MDLDPTAATQVQPVVPNQPTTQDTATAENMLGGCNIIHRKRDEIPVWQAPARA